ncbi:hypothetical protein COCNU_03G010010 [Cocos nucifera]|uniref:Uncharacterized protein n=1 Tax=Cocos nucifera TaxID=13894 RepID=A0A8K0I2Z7_COCNU|nr:hypothetical protein COCNU_03G010010 [Cocos nucifera]
MEVGLKRVVDASIDQERVSGYEEAVDVDVIKAMASKEVEDGIKIQGGSGGGEVFGGSDGFVFGEVARDDKVVHHEMGLGRSVLP